MSWTKNSAGIQKLQLYDILNVMTTWNARESQDCVICNWSRTMYPTFLNRVANHWPSALSAQWLFVRTFTHQNSMRIHCKYRYILLWTRACDSLLIKMELQKTEGHRVAISNTSRHQIYRHWDRGTYSLGTIEKKKTTIWSITKKLNKNNRLFSIDG